MTRSHTPHQRIALRRDHAKAGRRRRGALVSRPHVPMRPLWRCRGCGAHWPCQPARLALLGDYRHDRTALLVYLGTLMVETGLGAGPGRHNVSRES